MTTMDQYKFCKFHQNEKIQMYCSNCDKTVCLKCISGPHVGHLFKPIDDDLFKTIDDVVHKIRDQLQKSMATMEDTITTFNAALNEVKTNHEDYSREIQTLTNTVTRKKEEWKKQIDEIVDMVLVQMKTIADKDFEELKKREIDLSKNVTDLQEFLDSFKVKLESAEGLSITYLADDFEEKEKSQISCSTPATLFPPHFVSDRIDISHLREVFGRIVRDDDEEAASALEGSINHGNDTPVETDCATRVSRVNTFVQLGMEPCIDTSTIATIYTDAEIDRATCISTVGGDKAWVGSRYYSNKEIALVNKDGQVLQKVNLGFTPGEITTTNTGEVLVTDYSYHRVNKYTKDGQYEHTLIKTSPYIPQGLCTTSDNDILVCLHQGDADNKVIRVSTTGQTKQTIKNDKQNRLLLLTKQNKPLFTDPVLVKENINNDICVVDGNKTLVVVNKHGQLRFKYPNTSTHSSISCVGIACDRLGNILLSDLWKRRIHMIDINGKSVQYVLDQNHGIKHSSGLSINNKGELWVCNDGGCEIRIIKYDS